MLRDASRCEGVVEPGWSDQQCGGLRKLLTPEGHYLWLCPHRAEEYRY